MKNVPLRHKIGLFALGIFFTFLALEIILRLGGFIFFSLQERANQRSFQDGEYVILALGESTTALGGEHSYPRQLEKILNERQDKIKFKVINKGIPATTTGRIVQNLPGYIQEYDPDMVLVMMGINDGLEYIHANAQLKNAWLKPLYELRTAKLLRLLTAHGQKKMEEDKTVSAEQWKKLEDKVNAAPTSENFTNLAKVYRAADKSEEEFKALENALSRDPENFQATQVLGEYYKRRGHYPKAIEAFQKVLQSGAPEAFKIQAYADLAESYYLSGQMERAEQTFVAALKAIPKHPGAHGGLGDLYLQQGRRKEAILLLEKQVQVDPRSSLFYVKLAYAYRQEGRKEKAAQLLEEGIRQNPQEVTLYTELAYALLEDKKPDEAEQVIKKAVEAKLEDPKGTLSRWLGHGVYAEHTLESFRKVQDILRKQGIPLVIVQYPMRSIQPLRELFKEERNIFFADNERPFKDAVAQEGYDVYFSDRFAGDFGHATPKGNFILAENIAKTILSALKVQFP